jgi:hypothetical protein
MVPKFPASTEYATIPGQIIFSNGFKVDLTGTSTWQETTLDGTGLLPVPKIYTKAEEIYLSLSKTSSKGLGTLIPSLMKKMNGPVLKTSLENQDPFIHRAATYIHKIALESESKKFDAVLKAADSLVGFGNGLTPSGDDFLGGMFYTLHLIGKIYPDQIQFDPSLVNTFMEANKAKTNRISFALMQDMSMGYGLAPLHEFVNSMLTNQPNDRIVTSALELAKVGNSTGWDILTGVLAGLISTRSYSKECQ